MASLQAGQDLRSMTFGDALRGQAIRSTRTCPSLPARESMKAVCARTIALRTPKKAGKAPKGTIKLTSRGPDTKPPQKKTTSIELFSNLKLSKSKSLFRTKKEAKSPKILSSIEQLKLLTKLEKAGLLSAVEKSGLTLSKIEKLGLLSTAEDLGLLSAASDRSTPGAVFALAFGLFALGPAVVFFTPDSTPTLVYAQYAVAAVAALGGAAAYGGATFLSKLQQ